MFAVKDPPRSRLSSTECYRDVNLILCKLSSMSRLPCALLGLDQAPDLPRSIAFNNCSVQPRRASVSTLLFFFLFFSKPRLRVVVKPAFSLTQANVCPPNKQKPRACFPFPCLHHRASLLGGGGGGHRGAFLIFGKGSGV